MNFHRKLLLSEVEVLQLTPLEHLRFRKNRNSSGLLTEKTCFTLNPRSFQPGLFTVCSNLFWKKTQWVRRRRGGNRGWKGGVGKRGGPNLELYDQVQTRQSCPQRIPALDDLTLEISLSFCLLSDPLTTISAALKEAKPSWASKVPSRRTPKHMCILNPPRRREAESSEVVGAHHL